MTTKRCHFPYSNCGNSSVGRAAASQAAGHEFEPRLPLFHRVNNLSLVTKVRVIRHLPHQASQSSLAYRSKKITISKVGMFAKPNEKHGKVVPKALP